MKGHGMFANNPLIAEQVGVDVVVRNVPAEWLPKLDHLFVLNNIVYRATPEAVGLADGGVGQPHIISIANADARALQNILDSFWVRHDGQTLM